MSISIMRQVWDRGPHNSTDRFVLLAIADHADDLGFCFPGERRLGDRCSLGFRTIRSSLRRLREQGWISQYREAHRRVLSTQISLEKLSSTPADSAGQTQANSACEGRIDRQNLQPRPAKFVGGDRQNLQVSPAKFVAPLINHHETPEESPGESSSGAVGAEQQPTPTPPKGGVPRPRLSRRASDEAITWRVVEDLQIYPSPEILTAIEAAARYLRDEKSLEPSEAASRLVDLRHEHCKFARQARFAPQSIIEFFAQLAWREQQNISTKEDTQNATRPTAAAKARRGSPAETTANPTSPKADPPLRNAGPAEQRSREAIATADRSVG